MTKKLIIVAASVLVFAAAFALKESERPKADHVPGQVVDISLPRLVDLGSDKCIPCKRMAPILEELSKEYRGSLIVEVLDVRKNPEHGRKWGIRVIPTQVFIDASGNERFRHEGFMAKKAILDKWKQLGVELGPPASSTGS